jgi:hypothetical protein
LEAYFGGNSIKKHPNEFSKEKPSNYEDLSTNGVDSFVVWDKWPECKDVFEDIQVQGNCSSSLL